MAFREAKGRWWKVTSLSFVQEKSTGHPPSAGDTWRCWGFRLAASKRTARVGPPRASRFVRLFDPVGP